MTRLGVVSFLNARPLVAGLRDLPGVECCFDVPARLADRLARGDVDAALIPIVDLLRHPGRFRIVSDACIACDGETMTVRVFSQVPPDRVTVLSVDPDSHTSVLLARVIWHDLFDRALGLRPLSGHLPAGGHGTPTAVGGCATPPEAVLLIGDKVVDPRRGSFAYEVDLGGAWRAHTGLPFVFAVWAMRSAVAPPPPAVPVAPPPPAGPHPAPLPGGEGEDALALAQLLSVARDRGAARAAEVAETEGPQLGWPVALARRYLTRCMKYHLDARARAGANLFSRRCAALGLLPGGAAIDWSGSPAEPAHA